jgi:hypothetical protein
MFEKTIEIKVDGKLVIVSLEIDLHYCGYEIDEVTTVITNVNVNK